MSQQGGCTHEHSKAQTPPHEAGTLTRTPLEPKRGGFLVRFRSCFRLHCVTCSQVSTGLTGLDGAARTSKSEQEGAQREGVIGRRKQEAGRKGGRDVRTAGSEARSCADGAKERQRKAGGEAGGGRGQTCRRCGGHRQLHLGLRLALHLGLRVSRPFSLPFPL